MTGIRLARAAAVAGVVVLVTSAAAAGASATPARTFWLVLIGSAVIAGVPLVAAEVARRRARGRR